jgi:hypothetical protein
MAITYSWKLTRFKKANKNNLTDVVFQTYWEKIGTDDAGNTGTFVGATPFDPAQVDPDAFIPYDSLTEEIVLGWIQAVVVGAYATHVNEQIQIQLDAKSNSVTEVTTETFPWSTSTSTTFVPPPIDGA